MKLLARLALVACAAMVVSMAFSAPSMTGADAAAPKAVQDDLAARFAPYLYLHPEESFYPVSPEYAISRSNLNQSQAGAPLIVSASPSVTQIASYNNVNAGYCLDNRMGTINDDGIKRDFLASKDSYKPTVYARVINGTDGAEARYVIQYWFFYAFNEGPMNTHEGDWETVSIVADMSQKPLYAIYSQHMSGEVASWGLVEKDDGHPRVFIALGSHANYFRPYEGGLGMASDKCSGSGRILRPSDYDTVMLGAPGAGNHIASQDWLDFAGNWGDYGAVDAGARGQRGPQGPAYFDNGQRWSDPIAWSRSMKAASDNWFTANWLVANLLLLMILLMLISLAIQIVRIYRLRKRQGTLGPRLMPFAYIDGGNRKSIAMILGIVALIIGIIGFFLPWYTVSINVGWGGFATGGFVDLMKIDGTNGLQLSRLDSGNGLVQVAGFPVPLAWIMLFGVVVFVIGTIGIQLSRKMGSKLIGRGVGAIAPIIAIVIIVAMLGTIVAYTAPGSPSEVAEVVGAVSMSPLGGSATRTFGDYGTASLRWGLGIGALVLILAGILFFIAGFLAISANCSFYEPRTLQYPTKKPSGPVALYQQPPYQASEQQPPALPQYQPPPPQYQPPPPPPPHYQPPPQREVVVYVGQAPPPQPPPQYAPQQQAAPQHIDFACPYCGRVIIANVGASDTFRCPYCSNVVVAPK